MEPSADLDGSAAFDAGGATSALTVDAMTSSGREGELAADAEAGAPQELASPAEAPAGDAASPEPVGSDDTHAYGSAHGDADPAAADKGSSMADGAHAPEMEAAPDADLPSDAMDAAPGPEETRFADAEQTDAPQTDAGPTYAEPTDAEPAEEAVAVGLEASYL